MHDKQNPIDLTVLQMQSRQSFWQGVLVGFIGALVGPYIYTVLIGA